MGIKSSLQGLDRRLEYQTDETRPDNRVTQTFGQSNGVNLTEPMIESQGDIPQCLANRCREGLARGGDMGEVWPTISEILRKQRQDQILALREIMAERGKRDTARVC